MVESISKANQNKITEFVKDEIIFFAIGNAKYDNVIKFEEKKGDDYNTFKAEAAFADLDQSPKDCENFFKYLKMYDETFRRFKPTEKLPEEEDLKDASGSFYNCFILKDANMEYIVRVLRLIRDYIKKQSKSGKKVVLFTLVAGHGMIVDNEQVVLCNKITDKRFYQIFPIQSLICSIAAEMDNLYSITAFACCRQKFIAKDFYKFFKSDGDEV